MLNSKKFLFISVMSLIAGSLFCIMAGVLHLRYHPKKTQDVYTTGIIISKSYHRLKRHKKTDKRIYKIGIIYSLNPKQPISSTALKRVKRKHDKALRGFNVDREKVRNLSTLFAKANNIKQEDVLYQNWRVSRAKHQERNVNDVIKLEYISQRPWVISSSLDQERKDNKLVFRIGIMLLLFGGVVYYIRHKIEQFF